MDGRLDVTLGLGPASFATFAGRRRFPVPRSLFAVVASDRVGFVSANAALQSRRSSVENCLSRTCWFGVGRSEPARIRFRSLPNFVSVDINKQDCQYYAPSSTSISPSSAIHSSIQTVRMRPSSSLGLRRRGSGIQRVFQGSEPLMPRTYTPTAVRSSTVRPEAADN
jgi:hypothetical protein